MKLIGAAAAGLMFTAFAGAGHAQASEASEFRCRVGGLFSFIEVIPEEGRARYEAAGTSFYMEAMGNGTYANDGQSASFEKKGGGGTLWFGDASYGCERVFAGAPNSQGNVPGGSAQAQAINMVGQSLGGKLRSGPGTNYAQVSSVSEGTWLTILNNTGVRFDGFDWFEVVFDNGRRGFQWGGIMCSNGPRIEGIYASCQSLPGRAPAQTKVSAQTYAAATGGFMAFAVAPNGAFGHGAGPSRQQAEATALRFCGQSGCRIEDVTQANCHAMAIAPGVHWFGAGQTKNAAANFAMGFCSNSGASGCRVEYSYCQR